MTRSANVKLAIKLLLSLTLSVALAFPAFAQYQVAYSVFGNGGAICAGGDLGLSGTLGQPLTGVMTGTQWELGSGFWTGFRLPTDVDGQAEPPAFYRLSQNQPNPFNPVTTIRYAIKEEGQVTMRLYDIKGRQVRRLLGEHHAPGYYELVLDARGLSSGVYFYRLEASQFSDTKKLVLLK